MTLDPGTIAGHGALLSLAGSAVLMGALRYNPRLFLRHFPAAVRDAQPPLSAGEKAVGRFIGCVLIALLVGVPTWSAHVAARTEPGWPGLFVHAFLVGMIFNAVDWLLLDELWIGVVKPKWVLPPGVGLADVPFDRWRHFRGFLTGTILCAVMAVLAATVARTLTDSLQR